MNRATVSLPRPGDENDRFVLDIEVDEHGDVGLPTLGGGLVEADRLEPGEVEALHGLADVMLDDAPQALAGRTPMMRAAAKTGISRTSIMATCSNRRVKRLPSTCSFSTTGQ